MAQNDHINKKPKKKKSKNNSRIIQNIMLILAVLLVVLFAGILYFVSKNGQKDERPAPVVVTQTPKITLPEKPEERFKYLKALENPNASDIDLLPNLQAEQEKQQILSSFVNDKPVTTAPIENHPINTQSPTKTTYQTAAPQNTLGNFLLQCGAFKDNANAEALKAKLAMIGTNSSIKGDKLFRVIVGPFNSKSDAENTINSLKSQGISGCINVSK